MKIDLTLGGIYYFREVVTFGFRDSSLWKLTLLLEGYITSGRSLLSGFVTAAFENWRYFWRVVTSGKSLLSGFVAAAFENWLYSWRDILLPWGCYFRVSWQQPMKIDVTFGELLLSVFLRRLWKLIFWGIYYLRNLLEHLNLPHLNHYISEDWCYVLKGRSSRKVLPSEGRQTLGESWSFLYVYNTFSCPKATNPQITTSQSNVIQTLLKPKVTFDGRYFRDSTVLGYQVSSTHLFPAVLCGQRTIFQSPQVQFQISVWVRIAVSQVTYVITIRKLLLQSKSLRAFRERSYTDGMWLRRKYWRTHKRFDDYFDYSAATIIYCIT